MLHILLLIAAALFAAWTSILGITAIWLLCLIIHPLGWTVILSKVGLTLFLIGFTVNIAYILYISYK